MGATPDITLIDEIIKVTKDEALTMARTPSGIRVLMNTGSTQVLTGGADTLTIGNGGKSCPAVG